MMFAGSKFESRPQAALWALAVDEKNISADRLQDRAF
jgi:hypothetical protein